MKKPMAVMLAASLMLQAWLGAAAPVQAAAFPQEKNAAAEESETSSAAKESSESTSDLVVEVTSTIYPFQEKVTVKVSGDGQEHVQELDFQNVNSQAAKFELSPGNYQVTVAADKFADYTQSIAMEEDYTSKIRVCTTKTVLDGGKMCGWFRPGDMNQDGVIDSKDTQAVLNEIRNNPAGTQYDLTADGKTDIADLQCVVQSMDEKGQESSIEKQKLVKVKEIQAVEGTTMVGMEDFLNQKGTVSLMPADTETEISPQNPVGMEFKLAEDAADPASIPVVEGMTIYAPVDVEPGEDVSSAITDGMAEVYYVDGEGNESKEPIQIPLSASGQAYAMRRSARAASVNVEPDGSLVLDFGTQIAVKRVIITITGTKKTEPLVNIAKVEFVNNMQDRIPPPQLDIPELKEPVSGDKCLTVSWSPQVNVTGYEVFISGPVKGSSGNESQIIRVTNTTQIISSINDKSLVNFGKYTLKVRSVNGEWTSPWSGEKIGTVVPQSKPAKPDNVRAEGGYLNITVTWKDMDDADGYMVYYKKSSEADSSYRPVVEGFQPSLDGAGKLNAARYVINGLEKETEYDVYVMSWNALGWGPRSIVATATVSGDSIKMPKYHLINTSNGAGVKTSHIADAVYGGHGGAHMEGSALDTSGKSAWGLVDNNFASYWVKEDWDDGVQYYDRNKGVTITLDDYYKMGYMTFAAMDEKYAPGGAKVFCWEKGDTSADGRSVPLRLFRKPDGTGKYYYIVKFDEPITTNKIRLMIGSAGGRLLKIGEIQFHDYDTLEEDVMALYEDEMHTTLRSDVTEAAINALEARVEQVDEVSQEKHPLYSELMLEIRTAREILNGNLEPAFIVDNQITAKKDGHLGFGGLNEWQPLGKVAHEGETLIIYVGHNTKRTGVTSDLKLIMTQHHAESNAVSGYFTLKVGRNVITFPKLTSNKVEHGGQLYIAYQGNNVSDKYAVRVNGCSDIPALNVKGKTGNERKAAIQDYVKELEAYVGTIQQKHEDTHVGTKNVDYPYDQANCILNATDIMLDQMMYSIPATKAWEGIKNASDKAAKLEKALKAMDDTMTLFYQHKGLSNEPGTDAKNLLPSQHLNIRYMRMFAGAFMYAAGNHIGIEYASTSLATGPESWDGFGWGIAHEIGHNINQGTYAVAEVTNNYFAQLLTGKTRFTYENVYKKVTSGTVGRASNVFTQLALYWQLHLAFDNQKVDRHIYDNYQDQFNNLFFARVDTYSRDPKKAPKSGLTLNGGTDQNLMRLSCAAANKNILPFFERWGMTPDEATVAYAQKYGQPEEKALYYVNAEARNYRVDHPETEDTVTVKGRDAVTKAQLTAIPGSSQVRIDIKTDQQKSLILGYEISRSMTSNGQKQTEVVGFVPIDTAESTVYVDTVASINNRVMEYEVRAVDQYLNYSNTAYAGAAKIQTDGVLDKSEWTVETDMISQDDVEVDQDEENPDSGYDSNKPGNVAAEKAHTIDRIIDNNREAAGTYTGTSEGTAQITVDMHKVERVTALKYQGSALDKVSVEVSQDGSNWIKVKSDFTGLTGAGEKTVWFDSLTEDAAGNTTIRENWIGTYHARYVRLAITQTGTVSIQEIEICGPSGDNLEFLSAESGEQAIGVLSADYRYGSEKEDVIPKGSLIFTGIYKGNPAYNLVMLYDTEGNVIGARDGETHAEQVIFAEDPKDGDLGEMSDGTWVYYVRPEHWDPETLKTISGVRGELYRVDDALVLSGERIVSDTKVMELPKELPEITFTGGGKEFRRSIDQSQADMSAQNGGKNEKMD